MASNVSYWQARAILDYYGYDSTIWQKVKAGTATDTEIILALNNSDAVRTVTSNSGAVLGYDWDVPLANDLDDILGSADSNAVGGSYAQGNSLNAMIPAEFSQSQGSTSITSGPKNSLGQTVAAVADKVNVAVIGANIGAKLGKSIGTDLYNADPNWWADHLPDVGPWFNDVFGQDNLLGDFVRTFLTVDNNGNATAYVDEKVVASYYQALRDANAWPGQNYKTVNLDPATKTMVDPNNSITVPFEFYESTIWKYENLISEKTFTLMGDGPATFVLYRYQENADTVVYSSKTPLTFTRYDEDGREQGTYPMTTYATIDGKTVYYNQFTVTDGQWEVVTAIPEVTTVGTQSLTRPLAWIMQYGDVTGGGGGVPGVDDITGATAYPPDAITGTTTQEVLDELKQTYPDLFANPITSSVMQPDGTINTSTYVPIPWIDGYKQDTARPVSTDLDKSQTQDKIIISPETFAQLFPETQPDTGTDTDTPAPPTVDTPTTGTGTTDPIAIPVGQASALWSIYNPTQAELNSFGGWLWSSNFVEQLKKLFNDPMQAIIGVHKVFAAPHTGNTSTIVCGYLDSGVSSKLVTSQYSEVNCGSVDLWEYFGNVFDYAPYTSVKLFLPFIGIVPLDVAYVMRSTITVKYTVDVLTGACIANVNVQRDGAGGVIFTYAGSAIVSYPISSGSYMGVVSGALSMAAGIAGTIASGGAALPAIAGTMSGLARAHTDVQHSGQFTGAAGAMGGKKPYLIISRPQTRVAGQVERYLGYPSNATLRIGDCVGFTKITDAHLSIPGAYNVEVDEILQLLRDGVII